MLYCNYTATVLPFGVAAGDEEVVPPAFFGISRPVSLSCRFYGVEHDTVYVRNNKIIMMILTCIHNYTFSIAVLLHINYNLQFIIHNRRRHVM